jgi:hypothetical protein
VSVNELVLVQGMKDTRVALRRWNERPMAVVGPWLMLSLATTAALLMAVWTIAQLSEPDPTPLLFPGVNAEAGFGDYLFVLYRNSLVLALHAMACVAGFMAGSSLPLSAANRSGIDRWVHEKAGKFAIAFVACATAFSLVTQAYGLGSGAATLSAQLDISPAMLLVGLAPHAVPELVALFLPLAAWLVASRRGQWEDLLAATVVTVSLAVPVLLASAAVEVWISPGLLLEMAG